MQSVCKFVICIIHSPFLVKLCNHFDYAVSSCRHPKTRNRAREWVERSQPESREIYTKYLLFRIQFEKKNLKHLNRIATNLEQYVLFLFSNARNRSNDDVVGRKNRIASLWSYFFATDLRWFVSREWKNITTFKLNKLINTPTKGAKKEYFLLLLLLRWLMLNSKTGYTEMSILK